MSGHGVVLWREKRMDVALVCAPRSALSGLMTTLCDHTQMPTHTQTLQWKRRDYRAKEGKGAIGLLSPSPFNLWSFELLRLFVSLDWIL